MQEFHRLIQGMNFCYNPITGFIRHSAERKGDEKMTGIIKVRKIYSDGRHNAFTDMEYWKGYYYIAFRNGNGHARPGPMDAQGNIIVIRSRDLKDWEARSIGTNGDDRDPALLNMGEELGLFFGSATPQDPGRQLYEAGSKSRCQTHAAFTTDGTTWSDPVPVYESGAWLWQVECFKDICYGTAYNSEGTLKIARSTNGRNWKTVSTIPADKFKSTEAGLWITDDDVMHIVDRASDNPVMALLAEAHPPYTDWKLTELNYTVHCPVIRPVDNDLWIAGKTITAQFPPSVEIPSEPSKEKIESLARQDERLAKTPQDWHAAIWRLKGSRLDPIVVFPSRGDCGYPGLVIENNRVLMSYYSQHDIDNGPEPEPGECASEIYLAEVSI